MKEEMLIVLASYAVKFGIDAAIALANAIKNGKTIDDAIAALEVAKTVTAQQYREAVQP